MKLEEEEKVTTALTLHSEDIAAKLLLARDIKVRNTKRSGRVEVNRGAWQRGVDDSKSINLDERAITD